MEEKIRNKIRNIVAQVLKVDLEDVELDTAIGDLPEWDSLHHLHIIVELENEFDIKYAPEDLAELEDISDLITLTKENIG